MHAASGVPAWVSGLPAYTPLWGPHTHTPSAPGRRTARSPYPPPVPAGVDGDWSYPAADTSLLAVTDAVDLVSSFDFTDNATGPAGRSRPRDPSALPLYLTTTPPCTVLRTPLPKLRPLPSLLALLHRAVVKPPTLCQKGPCSSLRYQTRLWPPQASVRRWCFRELYRM